MNKLALSLTLVTLLAACSISPEPDLPLESQFGPWVLCYSTPWLSYNCPMLVKGDGDTSTERSWVTHLQDALKRNSHTPGISDGDFGSGTEGAVKSFQKARCLGQDGQVGSLTWRALTEHKNYCGTSRLTHSEAKARLFAGGITSIVSSGNCSYKNRSNCTSLEYIKTNAVDRLIAFKNASGCSVTITGGTEIGHAGGTYSHENGYKIDIRLTDCVNTYIQNTYTYVGRRSGDNAATYQDSRGNNYYRESSHWDILYRY